MLFLHTQVDKIRNGYLGLIWIITHSKKREVAVDADKYQEALAHASRIEKALKENTWWDRLKRRISRNDNR